MHLRPYLSFDGRCAEAMAFYQSTLGGQLDVIRYRDNPDMPAPPEAADRVMHARLLTPSGDILMASDSMPGQPSGPMSSFGVTLAFDTADQARRVFDTLATGGKVGMPMNKTFWAEAFGMVTDRFGTPWLVNGHLLQP